MAYFRCKPRVHFLSEHGRHVARLPRRRRRRAYAPTSNTASHDNHEKIGLWVSFFSLAFHIWDGYGAPLGGLRPPELSYQKTAQSLVNTLALFL